VGKDSYPGLPRATPVYLRALAADNRKDWFDAHRADYERDWKAAGLDLVAALAPFCAEATPRLSAVPRVGRSLRRIHRDVRFSADKTPYAPMLHLAFTVEGGADHAGMHLVVEPETLSFGAGEWGLPPDRLHDFRLRLHDGAERAALMSAAAAAEAAGSRWDPPDLKRMPKGYAASADWEHLLRRKSVILRGTIPLPDWLHDTRALPRLCGLIEAHLPLLRWLADRRGG
jgi:uncharacterized protein (TIGR02453 family)